MHPEYTITMKEVWSMKIIRVLLPFLLLIFCFNAAAETEAVQLDPSQKTFFTQFRTAVQAEDTRQIIWLTHPQAKQCVREDDREYYYRLILNGLVRVLGHQQTIQEVMVKNIDADEFQQSKEAAEAVRMNWPVEPEKQIIITYEKDGIENVVSLYISKDKDNWKWVHLCTQ